MAQRVNGDLGLCADLIIDILLLLPEEDSFFAGQVCSWWRKICQKYDARFVHTRPIFPKLLPRILALSIRNNKIAHIDSLILCNGKKIGHITHQINRDVYMASFWEIESWNELEFLGPVIDSSNIVVERCDALGIEL